MGHEALYNSDGKLYLRKSMLEEFGFCPYRFKKVWIDGEVKIPNQVMLVGTRFHDFAQMFFDYCHALPPHRWGEMVPKEFTVYERNMAMWFVNNERARYQRLVATGREDEWRPIQRELYMQSDELLLAGTIDRVDWWDKSKNQVCVVEYKTGGKFNRESIIKQLIFYMLLWDKTIGLGQVVMLRYVNPRLGIDQPIAIERWYMDSVFKEISKVRKAIAENVFPKKCSEIKYSMCKGCTPEECGVFQEDDGKKFSDYIVRRDEKFSDIYVD